jgi:hypothetical protein
MDDRAKGILNQIRALRIEMWRVEAVMQQQMNYDLDYTLAGMRLLDMRTRMAKLTARPKTSGTGKEITIEERMRLRPTAEHKRGLGNRH